MLSGPLQHLNEPGHLYRTAHPRGRVTCVLLKRPWLDYPPTPSNQHSFQAMNFRVLRLPRPSNFHRIPDFFFLALLDHAGVLYLAARYASRGQSSEWAVVMAAHFDAVPTLMHRGKVFVPARWMEDTYPDCAGVCRAAIDRYADDMLAMVAPPEWISGDTNGPSYW